MHQSNTQFQSKRHDAMTMTTYASLTDYPRIFEKTYWGRFDGVDPPHGIIENRNMMVREFGIVKKSEMPCLVMPFGQEWDHMECYKVHDGLYLVINSPYIDCDEYMRGARFKRLPYRVYSESAVTYYRLFDSSSQFKSWVKLHQPFWS